MIAGALYAVCAAAVALAIGEWEWAIISFFNGAIILLAFWWLPRRAVRRRLRAG
jgi:membrane protein implicated in regulation of membrane protease activity